MGATRDTLPVGTRVRWEWHVSDDPNAPEPAPEPIAALTREVTIPEGVEFAVACVVNTDTQTGEQVPFGPARFDVKVYVNDGADPVVVATGGLAPLIGEVARAIQHVDETLTLEGVRLLWEQAGGR